MGYKFDPSGVGGGGLIGAAAGGAIGGIGQAAGSTIGSAVGNKTSVQDLKDNPFGNVANSATGGLYGDYINTRDRNKRSEDDSRDALNSSYKSEYGTGSDISSRMSQAEGDYRTGSSLDYGDFKNKRNAINEKTFGSIDDYQTGLLSAEDKFQKQSGDLRNEATRQSTDAKANYTNNIQPRFKDLMEKGKANADSAMTLKDYQNPNNKVMSGIRNLYETQATNENKAGLADVGVLSSLGAQAYGNQFGYGQPVTGAQQQLAMAQTGSQAGQAYQNTQKRIQALRDQGLDRAFQQNDTMYRAGQDSLANYGKSVGDYQNSGDQNAAQQGRFRGEIAGYGNDILGSNTRRAQDVYGANLQKQGINYANLNQDAGQEAALNSQILQSRLGALGREQGLETTRYGKEQGAAMGDITQARAQQAAQAGILSSGIGAAGTVVGSIYGGPAGGAAGGAAGNAVGGAVSPSTPPTQQYGNLNQGAQNPYQAPGGIWGGMNQSNPNQNPYAFNPYAR